MTMHRWLSALACLALCPMVWGCQSECVLDDDVRQFAGGAARDCGTVQPDDERAAVDECVADAFEAGEPFIARYEHTSVDSKRVTAIASNSAGTIKIFQWDQAPCGGPGCDPVTDVQSCREPLLASETSEDPSALPIACGDTGVAERICGG